MLKNLLICTLLLCSFAALSSAVENKKWLLSRGRPLRIRKNEAIPGLNDGVGGLFRHKNEATSGYSRIGSGVGFGVGNKNESPALLESQNQWFGAQLWKEFTSKRRRKNEGFALV